jgi:photosystem II stability/assembly factor-like uncharacterized protein
MFKNLLLFIPAFFFFSFSISAQKKTKPVTDTAKHADPLLSGTMKWRNIGPFRAGRCLAVTGLPNDRFTYYMGAVGGGVWKTGDGGLSWISISDSTFHSSSVGAIAVAPSNQNILYVGMGEVEMRNNISNGDGVYKSTDAGKTWKHIGLEKSYAIGTIVVHPQNENLVYAAAQGKIFGVNKERGLYRSKDGGVSWENILFVNDSTGCCDVKMDPTNPLILYATMWQSRRTAYSLESGGKGDGLYKSTDGGNTWKKISENPGLPKGLDGKIIVSVSPVDGNRLYALVENKTNGGVYKSYDGGAHWMLMTTDNNLKQRPWYFSQIFCDPKNVEIVYILNVQSWKSIDGGKTFSQRINNNHGDNHDLWIDPNDPARMIIGDDGGAEISIDGGINWTASNLPTAQFYHVNLDNDFPYNVYGDQQDNSSVRIASKTDGYSIDQNDWHPVAGGESGYIVPDPLNSHITYGGEYDGSLSRYNDETHQYQDISVYPVAAIGSSAGQKKYRFQWTYPIVFSPHDPHELFVCSQYVHRSYDGGNSWEIISPDLTAHDSITMKPSGGPITKDNTGAEIYADIFAFAESPVQKGILWTGSDDGMIYVSKDDGKSWTNVTPPAALLPKSALISIIEPSHFDAGTVYVAATRYKSDDTKPYLLKSTDYGKTWKLINNGIRSGDYTRVVREDPSRKGLLYAGTETGIYISFNDGASWSSFQLNLPVTPVHDIRIQERDHDLVIATHGRSFWILDDLTPFYDTQFPLTNAACYLFKPDTAIRTSGGSYYFEGMQSGQNAPNGVTITYYLKNKPKKELRLIFLTEKGDTVKSLSSTKRENGEPIKISKDFYEDKKIMRNGALPADSGLNRIQWDMRYPDATKLEMPSPMWGGSTIGPRAVPGNYKVKLYIGDTLMAAQNFVIKEDPRYAVSQKDLEEQLALHQKINQKLSETHKAINELRSIRSQINIYIGSVEDSAFASQLKKLSKPILDSLQLIEDALVQHKANAQQDLLNYPIRLNDKIAGIASAVSSAESAPTKQSYIAYDDISALIDVQLTKLKKIKEIQIPAFNAVAKQKVADPIKVK